MNETEWMTSEKPDAMLAFIGERGDKRKLRLYACACVRRGFTQSPNAAPLAWVEMLERLADGKANWRETGAVLPKMLGAGDKVGTIDEAINMALYWAAKGKIGQTVFKVGTGLIDAVARQARDSARALGENQAEAYTEVWDAMETEQADLVREIFGNPFRPVAFDPAWLRWHDGTAAKIARQIYEERRFADMPILADALEEAGCTDETILEHCRQPGRHVLGCWVVDGLLIGEPGALATGGGPSPGADASGSP